MIKCYWCFIATSVHFCWKLHWIVYFEFWRNVEASFSIETMLILGMWSEVKWSDVTWRDIQPSMVIHTQISCSAFTHLSAHTQQWTHTHTPWTHTRSSGQPFMRRRSGEQLGVWCLAQGHLSRGIEGGESAVHSLPPPTILAGPRLELATFRLWFQLSTIRLRLPLMLRSKKR